MRIKEFILVVTTTACLVLIMHKVTEKQLSELCWPAGGVVIVAIIARFSICYYRSKRAQLLPAYQKLV